ncbi:MAG: peptide chain release factor-like protein [Chlamydiia bacterium]|nr:peptide chain release factor-like protein [Chlamydiia bacterium]
MTVSKEKQEALKKRMEALGIHEEDLIEKFILGSGSGGQKVNKTSSCVYLKHLPTKIEVKCQQERSREMNRFLARRELCDQIAEKLHQEKTARKREIEKIRQQKKRRSRRLQKKILEEKRKRSETKSLRKKPEEG